MRQEKIPRDGNHDEQKPFPQVGIRRRCCSGGCCIVIAIPPPKFPHDDDDDNNTSVACFCIVCIPFRLKTLSILCFIKCLIYLDGDEQNEGGFSFLLLAFPITCLFLMELTDPH
jgi:hypothetical protein